MYGRGWQFKLKMRNQIYLLDLIIEGLTDKQEQEQD